MLILVAIFKRCWFLLFSWKYTNAAVTLEDLSGKCNLLQNRIKDARASVFNFIDLWQIFNALQRAVKCKSDYMLLLYFATVALFFDLSLFCWHMWISVSFTHENEKFTCTMTSRESSSDYKFESYFHFHDASLSQGTGVLHFFCRWVQIDKC